MPKEEITSPPGSKMSCAMLCSVQMHGSQAGLVLAPHLYPPSITWNPAELPDAAAARWNLSWALKWLGLDTNSEVGGNLLRMQHCRMVRKRLLSISAGTQAAMLLLHAMPCIAGLNPNIASHCIKV
jgi:hypothetical protein